MDAGSFAELAHQMAKAATGIEILTKQVENLCEVVAETRDDLKLLRRAGEMSAEKVSSSEYRECYKTSELPAVIRFGQAWLRGDDVTLSAKHVQALVQQLKRTKHVSSTSLGYQHMFKDERRSEYMASTVYEVLVSKHEGLEVVPEHGQQGLIAHRLPAFHEAVKSEIGEEAYKNLLLPEIPPSLRAMHKLMEPVNRQYEVVKREDNKRNFLCAVDLAREVFGEPADTNEVFKKIPNCIQAVYNLVYQDDEPVTSERFTKVVVELFWWLAKAQGARSVLETAKWKARAPEQPPPAETRENMYKVFEVSFSSINETIKKAEAELPKELKSYLEAIDIVEGIEAADSGEAASSSQ